MKKPALSLLLFTSLLLTMCSVVKAQHITITVAGSVDTGYSGDNGLAKLAALNAPVHVCIDAAHNFYFSDQNNTRIRKVASGVITTIAGGGSSTADGISALGASIFVGGICCDPAGNIYFASASTSKIRRIDAVTNIITTVAGGGTSTADGIPALSASLDGLGSICIDGSNNIYITVANSIRKINLTTGIITTLATVTPLPQYIAVNHAGTILYFSNGFIYRMDISTGIYTMVVGGGSTIYDCPGASCGGLGLLSGLCCDANDDVVFNEWSCSCRKWDHNTDWVSLVGGSFTIESFANDTSSAYAYMNFNAGVCSDEMNNYYIADKGNSRIRKILQLAHMPSFVFDESRTIPYCTGGTGINRALWITDIDSLQTETWTVVTAPAHGTLGGFPATALSHGKAETTKPTGLTYNALPSFAGTDAFVVKVSDGVYSDTITIHVQVMPVPATPVISGPVAICIGMPTTMVSSFPGGTWSVSNPNASVSSSGEVNGVTLGSDNVLYTVDYGCSDVPIVKPITVYPAIDAGSITGPSNVCLGVPTVFANSATGGAWVSGTPHISLSSGGIVTGSSFGYGDIYYIVTAVCGSDTAFRTINVMPVPDAGVISGADELCAERTAAYTSSAPSGTWMFTNGHATMLLGGVALGNSAGLDTLVYTVYGTCSTVVAKKIINIKDCFSTAESAITSAESSINIYPNPASAILNIHTQGLPAGLLSISIADITNRVILNDRMNSTVDNKAIDISSLKDGVYILTISNDNIHSVNKIIVSK